MWHHPSYVITFIYTSVNSQRLRADHGCTISPGNRRKRWTKESSGKSERGGKSSHEHARIASSYRCSTIRVVVAPFSLTRTKMREREWKYRPIVLLYRNGSRCSPEKGKILKTRELKDWVEAVVVEASIAERNRNRRKKREFYLSIDTRIC